MLTQVAGRAGRGDISGNVIVQTYNPSNSILQYAINQDYRAFYNNEIESRKFFNYIPFSHLIKIVFKGKSEDQTYKAASKFYQSLSAKLAGYGEVQAALPCGYPKIKEYFRFQILIKGTNVQAMNQQLSLVEREIKVPSSVKILIDVDPSSTFF